MCYGSQQQQVCTQLQAAPRTELEPGQVRTPAAIADRLRDRLVCCPTTTACHDQPCDACCRLSGARQSRERHEAELCTVRAERDAAVLELRRHEDKAPLAAQRFRFYQELRGYVTDLVECLDEKVGLSLVHRGSSRTAGAARLSHLVRFSLSERMNSTEHLVLYLYVNICIFCSFITCLV